MPRCDKRSDVPDPAPHPSAYIATGWIGPRRPRAKMPAQSKMRRGTNPRWPRVTYLLRNLFLSPQASLIMGWVLLGMDKRRGPRRPSISLLMPAFAVPDTVS